MNFKDAVRLLVGLKRPQTGQRRPTPRAFTYELEDDLQTELVDLARTERRPVETVQAELLQAALVQKRTDRRMLKSWQGLSDREQQVAALACLGYNNEQIGLRLTIATSTVKTHMSNLLRKFNLHSKNELRRALANWDFTEWEE